MKSTDIWQYKSTDLRHVAGRKVYAAYLLGEFAGYRVRITEREKARIRKRNHLPKSCGIPTWQRCTPDELIFV